MGSSSDSPPENPKNDVVMGYPSASAQDNKNNNQTQQMYPPPPPPPPPVPPSDPKSDKSQSSYQQQYPNPYAPQSPYNLYATPSPYQPYPPPPYNPHDPNYMNHPGPYDYYYQHQYTHESNGGGSASFGRVLLILLLMLLSSIMMMSLIMWILFGASAPEFQVASIKVANFSTATNNSGTWSVQMWVSNVNMELDVRFDHGISSVFYKDSMLGAAALQPFDVRKTQRFGLNFVVPALQDQKWVPATLAEDRGGGLVVVSLRLAVDANFTSSSGVYRHERLRVLCEDFPISFATATTGEGTMSPTLGLGNNCFIRLREGRD